jgi:serine/threonine protein kinase
MFSSRYFLLTQLNHPFVIRIVSTFQTEEKFYFVLEYCPGG